MRKLVTIRSIENINPIEGADLIEAVTIGGWKCVAKKGEFSINDKCVYFEVDSILPGADERFKFLEKSFKDYSTETGQLVYGHRLKTIRLKGQISQGLALPLTLFPEITSNELDTDLTDLLKIQKYEIPQSGIGSHGQRTGSKRAFPSYLRKSDQERCQNLKREIFSDPDKKYEVTQKLDGQSGTFFYKDGELGLCSRNLRLGTPRDLVVLQRSLLEKILDKIKSVFKKEEIDSEDYNSNWHRADQKCNILKTLKEYKRNIAIQGEIIGPSIQSNYEKVDELDFYVYNIFDIDSQEFLLPAVVDSIILDLNNLGASLKKVPAVSTNVSLKDLGVTTIEEMLSFAEGQSFINSKQKVREGIVFKSMNDSFQFKAISNKYLLNEK